MKRMFRIQRMFLAITLLLLFSLPAAAAGGAGRPAAEGAAWRGFLAEVSAWLGERLEGGMDLLWGAAGSSIDPNGGTTAATGDGGSSIDPDGRP